MIGNSVRDARSDFALAKTPAPSTDHLAADPVAASRLPDQVARIWDRLELRDRSMIVCLESIVRSVRIDGTAVVGEVVSRYVESQLRSTDPTASTAAPVGDAAAIRAELLESVLPRLAASEVVALPASGLDSPDAAIAISNPWLRLALLESGLIQLEPGADAAARSSAQRALVRGRSGGELPSAPSDEWSQLWFAIQRFSWTTLAIIPASPGESGLATASAIVAAGSQYAEGDVHLVDATGAAPHAVDLILASMSGTLTPGSKLVIALDNPISNPAAIPIARHAGVALLAVRLGDPSVSETRRTIDSVGREHFVGSVAIRSAAS